LILLITIGYKTCPAALIKRIIEYNRIEYRILLYNNRLYVIGLIDIQCTLTTAHFLIRCKAST